MQATLIEKARQGRLAALCHRRPSVEQGRSVGKLRTICEIGTSDHVTAHVERSRGEGSRHLTLLNFS